MIYLFTCLAIGASLFAVGLFLHYISKHPDAIEDKRLHSHTPLHSQKYDDYIVQDFISECWVLRERIITCQDIKRMGGIYWEIEELSEHYAGSISDQNLIKSIDELFDVHTRRALELRMVSIG